jgi:acyl-[acyl-carrier-protein]-phospholipid O-acyltransferase/long-chain-fatty-acid--[acyl-carrier-protein] ligase
VPLYAIMQHDSSVKHRARIIAANNVMNAVFMVFAALATLAMLSAHFSIPQVFLIMAVANGVVAVYIGKLLPRIRVKPEV